MKTEWKLFIYLGVFMTPLALVYWVVSSGEETGIVLIFSAVAFFFIGIYLRSQAKLMDGLRPEDYDANPADGTGLVGSFPTGSIYPFLAALGATILCLGLVFNGFLMIPGVLLVLMSIVGMARESSAAEDSHADLDEHAVPSATSVGEFDQAQVKK